MKRKEIAAGLAIVLCFACLVFGQQYNPFTAVLNEPLTRPAVKVGRKRITIKETAFTHSTAKRTNSQNTTIEQVKRTQHSNNQNADSHSSPDLSKQTDSSTNSSSTGSSTMTNAEALDLHKQIGIQYQVLTKDNGGLWQVSDPNRVYHSGETFRLKIQSNINANLYLIAEDSSTGERRLIFPNYKYQQGSERVKPYQPVIVPPDDQPAFEFDNAPGEERLIVICSRDEIPTLSIDRADQTPTNALKLVSNSLLPRDIEQTVAHEDKDGVSRDFIFVKQETAKKDPGVYVVNTSKQDNEEVVYVIKLKHGD